jgi:hypothetical protein
MSGLTQSIKFVFSQQGGIETAKRLTTQIDKVTKSANEMALGINNADKSSKKLSDQGLANIQAGLVQLSTYLMIFNQNINNAFDKALNRFKGADEALNRLRITMGLTGQNSVDILRAGGGGANLTEYEQIESQIDHLAMTSQFTKSELADLFRTFKQAGKSVKDATAYTDLARKLSAAGGGLVSLAQAGDTILKLETAVGESAGGMGTSLDRLVLASQTSRLGLEDMTSALSSLRGAMQSFGDTGIQDAQLFAVLAAYKTIGLSPENAADSLKQVSAGMADLVNTTNRLKLRTGVFDLSKGAINNAEALKKAYERKNIKRNALIAALGITDEKAQAEGLRVYGKNFTGHAIEYLKDEMAKRMLMAEGGAKMDLTKFVELVGGMEDNLAKLGMGGAEVEATLKAAFGVQSLKTFKNAVTAMEKETNKSFRNVVDNFAKANGTLQNASDESLKSLESRLKLLESAEDALSNSIFKQDIVANGAIDTQTALVTSMNDLVKSYPSLGAAIAGLGRGMQITSGIGTNLGFMLTAAATFSIGLSHAQKVAGVSTKGLGAIMGSFHKVFLAPTLSVVLSLGGAFLFAGLMVVAFMKHISGADSIGAGFSITLQSIKDQASALTGFLKMAFGDGLDPKVVKGQTEIVKEISKLTDDLAEAQVNEDTKAAAELQTKINNLNQSRQKYLKLVGPETDARITSLSENRLDALLGYAAGIKSFFDGISSFMQGVLVPMSEAITPIIVFGGLAMKLILAPFIILAKIIASSETALKGLGVIIGSVFSVMLVVGFGRMVMGIVSGIKNSLVNAIGSARNSVYTFNTAMNNANQGAVRGIDRVRAAYKLLSGDAAGASAALGRDLSQVPAQRQAHLDSLKAQQQSQIDALKQKQLNEMKQARLDRGAVYNQAVLAASTPRYSKTGKPLKPTVNRHQVRGVMQQFDADLKQMAVGHQQQLQQLMSNQQSALVTQMQTFDNDLAKQEKVMNGRFANMANAVGSKMDDIGQRALGPLGALTALSGVIGGLAGESSTFGYIINTWVTPMLGLMTTMALLASTGFFTLAAGVIAATWPLLAAVAAISAVYYIYKKMTDVAPASAEPMSLAERRRAKQSAASSAIPPTQALASQAGVTLPQVPNTPTVTPASNPAGGFVTPVAVSGGKAPAAEVKTTNIQNVNVTINNKGALTAKQAEKITAEGLEEAANRSNSIS